MTNDGRAHFVFELIKTSFSLYCGIVVLQQSDLSEEGKLTGQKTLGKLAPKNKIKSH